MTVFSAIFFVFFCIFSVAGAYEIKDDREVSPRKPVAISASELTYDRLKGLTLFKGSVRASHNNVLLTADELRALTDNREATADGHVQVSDPSTAMTLTCGNLEYQDMMNLMTAHDRPFLTSLDEDGRPITIEGRQMELDSEKKTVVIHQSVKINHDGGRAEAQKATYLAREDKFVLEEDPQVFVKNGQLSGRRIVTKMGGERSILVEGMAEAYFNTSGPVTGVAEKKNQLPSKGPTPSVTPVNRPATGLPYGLGK